MEQLIFIGLLVAFSVLDAVARKRRSQGEPVEVPHDPEPRQVPAPGRRGREVHSRVPRDPGPIRSYDDEIEEEAPAPRPEPVRSSEGMVPAEIWEEIQRLAGGGGPVSRPRPQPRPTPRARPQPSGPVQAPRPEVHAVHRTHPDMGKPLRERMASPIAQIQVARRTPDVEAVRAMLAGGAPALRRAVILEEVLGPPAAVRGDPFEPVG